MPKEQKKQQKQAVSRQRPISCRFCRSRKLRCSREAPCSNCVSRGLLCELEYPNPSPTEHSLATPPASESELLDRIRKLEELVKNQQSQENEGIKQHSESSSTRARQLDDDVAWLESIYTDQNLSLDKLPSSTVVFRTCPIQQINKALPFISQNQDHSVPHVGPSRCVWLPQYPEAKALLEKYVQDIDHVYHVIHCPSLLTILDDVYASLEQQGQVKPGTMILLLSIFASCTHCWVQKDCERGLFSSSAEANGQASLWLKAIEDVIDVAHRIASISVEGIQGIIIASFVLLDLEGLSRRTRSMYNMALLLARELGLHYLDHPSNTHLAKPARAEIGRRVWWYLVASDWAIAARLGGTAQGVYQCHLRQMVVRKPLNIDDEEISDEMSGIERPRSHPTAMSYSLQRIRLSEISRTIVDRNPLAMGYVSGPSLDVVMDIDTELQLLINDIPAFFSMSKADLITYYNLDSSKAAKIVHQGFMCRSLIYSQRCKLHFPYFSRGFVDSAFACSRDICLQSARSIIRTESQLESSGLCLATRFKSLGLLVGIFMASIVVLVDSCYNKSSPQQEEKRGEIAYAFRILENARLESETATRFLDSLMHVMRKHKVHPPKNAGEQPLRPGIGFDQPPTAAASTTQAYGQPVMLSNPMDTTSEPPNNETSSINWASDGFANGEDFPSYFNDFAQSFEQGIDVGSIDWNNIFSGLDYSLI